MALSSMSEIIRDAITFSIILLMVPHYVQLWQFFDKNAITFDLTEIEKNKIFFVVMKLCCASNAAITKCQIHKRKNNLFANIFSRKSYIFQRVQIFLNDIYFWILKVLPVTFTTYFLFRTYCKNINQICPT